MQPGLDDGVPNDYVWGEILDFKRRLKDLW